MNERPLLRSGRASLNGRKWVCSAALPKAAFDPAQAVRRRFPERLLLPEAVVCSATDRPGSNPPVCDPRTKQHGTRARRLSSMRGGSPERLFVGPHDPKLSVGGRPTFCHSAKRSGQR